MVDDFRRVSGSCVRFFWGGVVVMFGLVSFIIVLRCGLFKVFLLHHYVYFIYAGGECVCAEVDIINFVSLPICG